MTAKERYIRPKRGGVIESRCDRRELAEKLSKWCKAFAYTLENTGSLDGDLLRFTESQTRPKGPMVEEWTMICTAAGGVLAGTLNDTDNPEELSLRECAMRLTFLIVGTPERAFPLEIPADTPERYRAGARELRARAKCFDDPEPSMAESEPKTASQKVDPKPVSQKADPKPVVIIAGAGYEWAIENHPDRFDDDGEPINASYVDDLIHENYEWPEDAPKGLQNLDSLKRYLRGYRRWKRGGNLTARSARGPGRSVVQQGQI